MAETSLIKDGNGYPTNIYRYTNIVAAAPTTTAVKGAPGFLHAIVINSPAATGVITVYDSLTASGAKIATITQPATLLDGSGKTVLYDVAFNIGLTIVTATAAQDITVSYI